MLVGMGALGWNILETGGGLAQVMATSPQLPAGRAVGVLLSPTSGGALATSLLLSAWVLVGFGTLGSPQSAVRWMSYRRSSDLHQAMIVSTVVCGALMIGMTVMGVFARGMLDVPLSEMGGTTDAVMLYLIANYMDPVTAGVTLIGLVYDVDGEFASSRGRLRHHEGPRALSPPRGGPQRGQASHDDEAHDGGARNPRCADPGARAS